VIKKEDFMGREKEKDELEGVESISREQAQKEMKQAAKNVRKGGSHKSVGKATEGKDEMDDVEKIPREQAEREIREAAKRAKDQDKKK
jgi:hypothetical protein